MSVAACSVVEFLRDVALEQMNEKAPAKGYVYGHVKGPTVSFALLAQSELNRPEQNRTRKRTMRNHHGFFPSRCGFFFVASGSYPSFRVLFILRTKPCE